MGTSSAAEVHGFLRSTVSRENGFTQTFINAMEVVIKQAERAQELERQNKNLEFNIDTALKNNHKERMDALRYRKALEFYADETNYEEVDQFMSDINIDSGVRARKALEEIE